MSRRELIPASQEHQRLFPLTFRLKAGLEDNLEAIAAFRHATKFCLWPDELQYVGAITERIPATLHHTEESGQDVYAVDGKVRLGKCDLQANAMRPYQPLVDALGSRVSSSQFEQLRQVFGNWADLHQLDPNSETYIAHWQTFLVSQPLSFWEG